MWTSVKCAYEKWIISLVIEHASSFHKVRSFNVIPIAICARFSVGSLCYYSYTQIKAYNLNIIAKRPRRFNGS